MRPDKLQSMDHRGRLRRLQEALGANSLDAILITHVPNVRYLCGFTGSAAALLITENSATFFADGRYTAQARNEVKGARVVIDRKPALIKAAEWASRRKAKGSRKIAIGIEAEHLSVANRGRVAGILGSGFRLKETPALVEQARMVKDPEELDQIQGAVLLGASLFDVAFKTIRPGVKETEVAAEMEYAARRCGAEGMSFETIVASGERSSLPHGRASNSPIPRHGFVVCDFGVILAGYCSDMTRTLYVGQPTSEARDLYQAVREAQQSGIEAVAPGVAVGEVDRRTRNVLSKKKLGRYFSHSTGHGVGLEIHEPPRIAAKQAEVLRPGMIVTIEPGVYIPGRWGVRIEDMLLVTERGCEVLTPTSKELISI